MKTLLQQPWPWYLAGILIGLIVPALLLLGNKHLGLSGNLRHICAACFPARLPFFQYDWKKEAWNLFVAFGILLGALIATTYLMPHNNTMVLHPDLVEDLKKYGITNYSHIVPKDLISWSSLFSLRGIVLIVGGSFLVGFGARYAGGCTSGHVIMGLSNLQWPSLVATICFMIGGFIMTYFILPIILQF